MSTRQLAFGIQGMFCAKCAVDIERALTQLDGVVAAQVNYATERATVVYDPTRAPAAAMVNAVRKLGFDVPLARAWIPFHAALRAERIAAFSCEALVNAQVNWHAHALELEWLADAEIGEPLPRAFVVAMILRALPNPFSILKKSSMQNRRLYLLSALAGVLGFIALFAIYIGIVSFASRSFAHAFELLAEDKWLVAAIATGFGAQVGLFAFLRLAIHAAARGAGIAASAGTGTSTLSMIACCAHHVTDVAPIVGLAGFTSAASFLAEYKVPFMLFGLAMNAVGIVITLRTIHKSHAHLSAMAAAMTETAPACH